MRVFYSLDVFMVMKCNNKYGFRYRYNSCSISLLEGETVFNYLPSFNSSRELPKQGFESGTIKVISHFWNEL
jgi:hypothetical protein